ncbi:hypothetical protein [Piscinibacter sakaiensis]|uniref:Uncharacterized protein n=1 Tax=Piscinibacter sakaiensis TaxID=1547922 RepID=A0A0K8NW98_PISS1|nr:hypothetical protein [Piscinibacter sakaiensis]GAP34662.1 hypothetical protein ISF6_5370 [Piscinibacter sakaiensis]
MALAGIVLGAWVLFVEPGTTAGLCGRVVHLGEGAGGIPTLWAVQEDSGRAFKAPVAEVTLGAGPGCAPVAAPAASAPSAPVDPPQPSPVRLGG